MLHFHLKMSCLESIKVWNLAWYKIETFLLFLYWVSLLACNLSKLKFIPPLPYSVVQVQLVQDKYLPPSICIQYKWFIKCLLQFEGILAEISLIQYLILDLLSLATVIQEMWCWSNKTIEFVIGDEDVTTLKFTQSGFILKCSLSHPITLVSLFSNL